MVEELFDYLRQFNKGVKQGSKYNQYSSKPTYLKFCVEDVDVFKEIYKKLKNSNLNTIKRTKSGAIAKGARAMCNDYAWDVIRSTSTSRITVTLKGYIFVFNLGAKHKEEIEITPSKAFKTLVNEFSNDGIDFHSYAIENGLEIKKTIPAPMISMTHIDETLYNVHHIDFHNSYPSGLANTHPELRTTIERLYNKRKENNVYKLVLNQSIGCMHSLKFPWKAQWAHLAKDAIEDNNKRVSLLAFQLEITGREIIGFNVDGIWYKGDIYHGDGEGDKLGEWHNDYTNCQFRAKSPGVYEFICNGKYYPKVRGTTTYEAIVPKSEWKWGDIYNGAVEKFKWDDEEGVIYYED